MNQYRKTPRAQFLNYDEGDFFITICTLNRKHYFGEIREGRMYMSNVGGFVEKQLREVHLFCERVDIVEYVVMPNHLHAIVRIDNSEYGNDGNSVVEQRCPNPSLRANFSCQRYVPVLSRYVASLKGSVTKYAKSIGMEFGWQGRYHDHLIRNSGEGNRIVEYIRNNVANWRNDCFYQD